MESFTDRVKDIALSYTEIIHATEDQNLENFENQSFAHCHTRREQPSTSKSNTSTSKSNNTGEKVHDIFTDDQSDDDTEITDSLDMITKIKAEIERYKSVKMKKEQKANLKLISWWQERKGEYPCLFKAVRSMLCTPATSVPSERFFSEAGYISRAKRSRILPANLDKYLFIKRNKLYLPENTQEYFNSKQVQLNPYIHN